MVIELYEFPYTNHSAFIKPSDELSRELQDYEEENYPADDRIRAKFITKIHELKVLGTGGYQGARDDLNAVGYFHVQPCYCSMCCIN